MTRTLNVPKIIAAVLTVIFMCNGHINGYVGSVILLSLCDIKVVLNRR